MPTPTTVLVEGHRYQMHQSFRFAYVLQPAKLTRLFEVIEGRLRSGGPDVPLRIEARTRRGIHISVPDIATVLSLENAVNDPLETVAIQAGDGHRLPQDEVVFSRAPRINVMVVTDNVAKTRAIYDEIDEQVSRTRVTSWVYSIFTRGILVRAAAVLAAALILFALLSTYFGSAHRNGGLSAAEAEHLLKTFQRARTSEERIAALAQLQQATLAHAVEETWQTRFRRIVSPWNIVLAVPLIWAIGALIYVIRVCYLRAVFPWGDWEDHYRELVRTRERMWGLVFGSFLLSVLASIVATQIMLLIG